MEMPEREITIAPDENQLDDCIYNLTKVSLLVIHVVIIPTQVGLSQIEEADGNGSPARDVAQHYTEENLIEPLGQDDVTTLKERLKLIEENLTAAQQKLNLSESTNAKLQQQLQESDSTKAILQAELDDRIADSNITESFRKDNSVGSFYTGMIKLTSKLR